MKIKGILFDKDGTLFNYSLVWGPTISRLVDSILMTNSIRGDNDKAREEMFRIVGIDDKGNSYSDGAIYNHYRLGKVKSIFRLLCFCAKRGLNPVKIIKLISSVSAHSEQGVSEVLGKMDFSDLRTLFEKLTGQGYVIGVVTNDITFSARTCLNAMGIADYVSFLRTRESNCKKKPNPEAIKQFATAFKLKGNEIAVVGDCPIDMLFARNGKAGYKIAVLTGMGDREKLSLSSDVVYEDINGLVSDKVLFPTE